MLIFLIYKKPFTEIALTYANIVTELGLCLIFAMISLYLFDMSNNSREQIDFLLIILVNVIISSQMLASLYITSKVLIQNLEIGNCLKQFLKLRVSKTNKSKFWLFLLKMKKWIIYRFKSLTFLLGSLVKPACLVMSLKPIRKIKKCLKLKKKNKIF